PGLAFGMLGSSGPVPRARARDASQENAPRMSTATMRLGMNARTWFTIVLTVVRWTVSAAMRMTMSRRYHFTTPATSPEVSVLICARRRKPVTPTRSAIASTLIARRPRRTRPARAPVMIQPSTRTMSAPRMTGIAERSAAIPAARPVSNAPGRSVTCAMRLFLLYGHARLMACRPSAASTGPGMAPVRSKHERMGNGRYTVSRTTASLRCRPSPARMRGAPMGTFVLALHSHLPYARGAGRWPHGEEWIHEAVLGNYLPLLVLLQDLREAGVPYRIVIGLTPILIEQLADHDIDVRNLEYIDDQIVRAEKDGGRFVDAGDHARAALADFYLGSYRRLREAYVGRSGRDLAGPSADLARSGDVGVLSSAA